MLVCSKGGGEESFGSGCKVETQALAVSEGSKCKE